MSQIWWAGGAVTIVLALLGLAFHFARRMGRQEAEAKHLKEEADAKARADKELVRPRNRRSTSNRLRDGTF